MRTEIEYKGILLEVMGTYTEAEDRVMYYGDLGGFPGSDSNFNINSVYIEGVDITSLLCDDDLREIEELVIDNIEG